MSARAIAFGAVSALGIGRDASTPAALTMKECVISAPISRTSVGTADFLNLK